MILYISITIHFGCLQLKLREVCVSNVKDVHTIMSSDKTVKQGEEKSLCYDAIVV